MNLLDILHQRVDSLVAGHHTAGIRSVIQHVQVAIAHLERGKREGDDTAFTDAIYRTNQAFEGSLKEAYRVLASKDPEKMRPFDIESFFQNKAKLRPRVLSQFTRYRQEWRNPSIHDYCLDFDEDEALLAIVSVTAFAIVLVDQISEALHFEKALAEGGSVPIPRNPSLSLGDQIADALVNFPSASARRIIGASPREAAVIGAMSGYLMSTFPDLQVEMESPITPEARSYADLLVTMANNRVIIELKGYRLGSDRLPASIEQVRRYMQLGSIPEGLLYLYSNTTNATNVRRDYSFPEGGGRVIVVGPASIL